MTSVAFSCACAIVELGPRATKRSLNASKCSFYASKYSLFSGAHPRGRTTPSLKHCLRTQSRTSKISCQRKDYEVSLSSAVALPNEGAMQSGGSGREEDGRRAGGGISRREGVLAALVAGVSSLSLTDARAETPETSPLSGGFSSISTADASPNISEGLVSGELQVQAIQAYRAKDLPEALRLFDEIVKLDPENPVWYERRGQVYLDLKQFQNAITDFNTAQTRSPENYISLGLLGNRGLAHEGLSLWKNAIDDYTRAIDLGDSIGAQIPYILNSRGNCFASIGEYKTALDDFERSADVFRKIRSVSGTIYSLSNAALMHAQLGDDDRAIKEMKTVARRAPGSIDMRAALAAMYWERGEEDTAEEYWGWACNKINSGQMTENGPVLDGCGLYKDMDWLARIRRWPPVMVAKMEAFVKLRSVGSKDQAE